MTPRVWQGRPTAAGGRKSREAAKAAERRYGGVCSGLGIRHNKTNMAALNEPVCLPKVKTAVVSQHNETGLGSGAAPTSP